MLPGAVGGLKPGIEGAGGTPVPVVPPNPGGMGGSGADGVAVVTGVAGVSCLPFFGPVELDSTSDFTVCLRFLTRSLKPFEASKVATLD